MGKTSKFEKYMRDCEMFHSLKAPPSSYIVLRVDGRGFSGLTMKYEKPFDEKFHKNMLEVTEFLMKELGGIFGYTESDEISILLPRDSDLFKRSVEKLVSTSAALASAKFSQINELATFDSRVVALANRGDVLKYFRWRMNDAARCALNGHSYWLLRKLGDSPHSAAKKLEKQTHVFKHELLFKNGINFNDLPAWQRRGTGFYFNEVDHVGFDPVKNESVMTKRRKLVVDEDLPYEVQKLDKFLDVILNDNAPKRKKSQHANDCDIRENLGLECSCSVTGK